MAGTPPTDDKQQTVRSLIIVLGDQLDLSASAFDGFDPQQDLIWMAEVAEESTHVWSTKPRIAVFLAAMRHCAAAIRARNWPLEYVSLDDASNSQTLAGELTRALHAHCPRRVIMTAPGDWRVWKGLSAVVAAAGQTLDTRPDRHFFSTVQDFAGYVRRLNGRALRMEYFYREMRIRHQVLMDNNQPAGDQWNFDKSNRRAFGKAGPGITPARLRFPPDPISQAVIQLVNARFAHHPGSLEDFDWPVTREQAQQTLDDFIANKLPVFGPYQDAIWSGEPWLYHSQLSAALNLKLLSPKEVVNAAEAAYRSGHVPLASAEGFIRQILGWREYVRGIYWTQMPEYLERNALQADSPLPDWYWTANTDYACLQETIAQTLRFGYAHHIQRLMVTGLFALLLGVRPKAVHEWYLAVYVDAVEWVELPNTLGMSQYADDGLMASKPYIATGRYIERMGGPCARCKYQPDQFIGETACPFTTLHWDFLIRHQSRLTDEPRLVHQLKRLSAFSPAEQNAITHQAAAVKRNACSTSDVQSEHLD